MRTYRPLLGARTRTAARLAAGALVVALTAVAAPAPAGAATVFFTSAEWRRGPTGFVNAQCSFGPCITVTSRTSYRSPSGNPAVAPRVGERFLLHVEAAIVVGASDRVITGNVRIRVLLPDGLVPSVGSPSGLRCYYSLAAASGATYTLAGLVSPCSGPTKVGVEWQFPAAHLENDEVMNYLLPVVATRPLTGTATQNCRAVLANCVQTLADLRLTDAGGASYNYLPNPIVSYVPVTVSGTSAPSVPRGVVATASRSSARVSWLPPSTGGATVTRYSATASPGGRSCTTTTGRTCVVTGLTNRASYRFTVRATNARGTGPASAPSAPVVIGVPSAPRTPDASPLDRAARVTWTAPAATGGARITKYLVTSVPGGRTCTTTGATACTVGGLTNRTSYRFTVKAANAFGTGYGATATTPTAVVAGAPSVPRNVVWTFPGVGQFRVTWSPPASIGSGRVLRYEARAALAVTSPPAWSAWNDNGTNLVSLDTGVQAGLAFRIQLRAVNASGAGPVREFTFTQPF